MLVEISPVNKYNFTEDHINERCLYYIQQDLFIPKPIQHNIEFHYCLFKLKGMCIFCFCYYRKIFKLRYYHYIHKFKLQRLPYELLVSWYFFIYLLNAPRAFDKTLLKIFLRHLWHCPTFLEQFWVGKNSHHPFERLNLPNYRHVVLLNK